MMSKKSTKKLNTVASMNLLSSVVLNGIQFFTLPIFTRMLGTENYGIVSIYLTWVNVFTIVLGLQTSGTIAIADVHIVEKEQKGYRSSAIFLSLLFSIVVLVIFVILRTPLSKLIKLNESILVLMLVHSLGKACVTFATSKYIYYKEAEKNFVISVGISVIGVILSFVFIEHISKYENRYLGNIWGVAIPYIIIGFFLCIMILREGRVLYNKSYWKFCLSLCLPLVLHSLSHLIMSQSDRVMLQNYKTESVVGIYSLTVNFGLIINVLWNAFNNTWVPFYYEDLKEGNLDAISKKSKNYIVLFTVLTCGFILLSREVFKIFAAKSFWEGEQLIPIVAVSYYFVFLYSFPVNFQFYHKKTLNIAVGTGISAVVNIILNCILIPRYSGYGAAIATLIAHVLLFLFHHILAKNIDKKAYNYSMKYFAFGVLIVILICAIYYLCEDIIIIRWGLGAFMGCAVLRRIMKERKLF